MTTAIRVDHLGKRYRIGAMQARFHYGMLRDVLMDVAMTPVHVFRSMTGKSMRGAEKFSYIWALNEFRSRFRKDRCWHHRTQRRGQKHLLKVLARVTEPTKGTVSVRGRVGSLLEVGTGFHPELTAVKTSISTARCSV